LKRTHINLKLTLVIGIILNSSYVFSQKECMSNNDPANVNCNLVEHTLATLKLKEVEIKNKYSGLEAPKNISNFKQDIESYLALHNQVSRCPAFEQRCPHFKFDQYLNGKDGIIVSTEYSSSGAVCAFGPPLVEYKDSQNSVIAVQLGTSIQIKFSSDCQNGESISFVAYPEGLLVMASSENTQFDSHGIARRIPLGSSGVKSESPDGKNLRILWSGRSENWIDIDPSTMTFKGSSFMKVDQLNSSQCKVAKQQQPANICNGKRAALIRHGVIKKADEYECIEYVPVIEGISSRISRG
jgi:hypothetical protein